jgi:hypothetical protein
MPEVEREICTDCEPPANEPAIDSPLPAVSRLSRRGFAHHAFKVLGGGALAVGAVSLLGVNPRSGSLHLYLWRLLHRPMVLRALRERPAERSRQFPLRRAAAHWPDEVRSAMQLLGSVAL